MHEHYVVVDTYLGKVSNNSLDTISFDSVNLWHLVQALRPRRQTYQAPGIHQ